LEKLYGEQAARASSASHDQRMEHPPKRKPPFLKLLRPFLLWRNPPRHPPLDQLPRQAVIPPGRVASPRAGGYSHVRLSIAPYLPVPNRRGYIVVGPGARHLARAERHDARSRRDRPRRAPGGSGPGGVGLTCRHAFRRYERGLIAYRQGCTLLPRMVLAHRSGLAFEGAKRL